MNPRWNKANTEESAPQGMSEIVTNLNTNEWEVSGRKLDTDRSRALVHKSW